GVKLGRPKIDSATSPSLYGVPVRGTFRFQIFILAPFLEIWVSIFAVREVARAEGVACFWATSLEKIFGGVTAIVSYRPGGRMQQPAVPRCAILSVRSTGGIGQ